MKFKNKKTGNVIVASKEFINSRANAKDWVIVEQIKDKSYNLEMLKSRKIKDCLNYYQSKKNNFLKHYNELEINTFNDQKQEFRAYQVNNKALTPAINEIATNRGIDRLELLQLVGKKVMSETALIGKQQSKISAIKACKSKKDLDNIIF